MDGPLHSKCTSTCFLGVEWDPTQSRLALCTANNKVYMWSPAGSLSVEVPSEGKWSQFMSSEKMLRHTLDSELSSQIILIQGCHHQGKSGNFLTFWKVREFQYFLSRVRESQGK